MKNEGMENKIYLTCVEGNAYFSLFTLSLFTLPGGLAQLARAPALQAGGQRFESVILHSSRRRVYVLTWKSLIDILGNNEKQRLANLRTHKDSLRIQVIQTISQARL